MKKLFVFHAAILAIGSLLLLLTLDWRAASSYGMGVLLVMGNVALLTWVWHRALQKKLVALALFLIVFKYAILGVILYQLLKLPWLNPLWFCVGIGTLLVASFGAALESSTEDLASL